MSVAPAIKVESASTGEQSLRVTHVVLSLECGGLEHVVVDLVSGGQARGQQVSVICLEQKGVLAKQLEDAGVTVHCCHKPSGLHIRRMRRELRRLLLEVRPDVVHSHQLGALFYAGPVSKSIGTAAVVHTEHGKHFEHRAKTRWLGRYAARFADRYCCVSRDIAADVIRHRIASPSKVQVVPNGIDTGRFGQVAEDACGIKAELGIPGASQIVGTVGRLAEIKRQDLLIHAFARLREMVPAAHLLLVGEGPERQSLEALAKELSVADSVHFAGYREDRERLLHIMDVFVLPSRSEGMPLSVLEAWAAGVPVLASRVGGLPELIDDGRTGRLVAGDDPHRWAQAIATLIADSAPTRDMTAAAKAVVEEQFSRSAMVQAYEQRYRDVIGTLVA